MGDRAIAFWVLAALLACLATWIESRFSAGGTETGFQRSEERPETQIDFVVIDE